jgi:hypothetical protein
MADPTQLLSDAKTLLTYASARGLVSDPTIFERVTTAQQKLGQNEFTAADEQDLNKIINALAKAIHPISIEALRNDPAIAGTQSAPMRRIRNLLRQLPSKQDAIPGLIFVICIVVMLSIIPLTTLFNRLAASITELRDTEQQDYFSIIHDARELQEQIVADKTKAQQLDPDLQSKIKKLREIQTKINVNSLAIAATIDLTLGVPKWLNVIFAAYGLDYSLYAAVKVPASGSSTTTQPPTLPSQSNAGCQDEICRNNGFAASLGITIEPSDIQGAYFARRQAESAAALLGGAMLPVLYGLLGASVYLMRRFLGEESETVRPNIGMTAFLRLGLGGIAGLAIGWFWVPTSAKAIAEVSSLTTAPFALAFLAGFSIELLFSLLDRIIAAINPTSSGPPNPPAKPASEKPAGTG